MVTSLILMMFLFCVGGVLSSRVLYMLLHIEGALLSAIAALYLAGVMVSPWMMVILLVMTVISASVALSLVVTLTRSMGSDRMKNDI